MWRVLFIFLCFGSLTASIYGQDIQAPIFSDPGNRENPQQRFDAYLRVGCSKANLHCVHSRGSIRFRISQEGKIIDLEASLFLNEELKDAFFQCIRASEGMWQPAQAGGQNIDSPYILLSIFFSARADCAPWQDEKFHLERDYLYQYHYLSETDKDVYFQN